MIATPFKSYSFCNGIRASRKLCECEYCLIAVLFVKAKEMSVKKFEFFLASKFCDFTQKKYRSRRAPVDQNDIKFVFWIINWFLGFIISLI